MVGKDINKLYHRILEDFKSCIDSIGKVKLSLILIIVSEKLKFFLTLNRDILSHSNINSLNLTRTRSRKK